MIDSDKQKLLEAKAAAWSSISSYVSVAEMEFNSTPVVIKLNLINVGLLFKRIGEQKKSIDKLIDSLPD